MLLKNRKFFRQSCRFFKITGEERIECIKKLLRLDHLNQDEYEHVERLIINSADRFQIPGEPLEATNVLQHSIPTTDDSPIFQENIDFPLFIKKKLQNKLTNY